MKVHALVGSGEKIMVVTLPVIIVGLVLQQMFPASFEVGGPPPWLRTLSLIVLAVGLVVWIWSVVLVLREVPKGELITTGPYALVKHPLYTGVALLVLPTIGFLLNSWLGALIGVAMYFASRRFAPEEERELAATFGDRWDDYARSVMIPWL
jgi:protein-S-isoprenylcysteine O-methyltransferase Ste14